MARYTALIIDPPWPKLKGGKRSVRPQQGRRLDYPTLPVEDIFDLLDREILPLLDEPGNVFLWAVDQFLWDAEFLMRERGFKLHARMVWDKLNGVAPAFSIRFSHEYVLWFYRPGRFLRPRKGVQGVYRSVISEASKKPHSRKPDAFYEFVREAFDGPFLDVFSRVNRPSFDAWGNEVGTVE